MSAVTRVAYVSLAVSDPGRALAFYRDVFALPATESDGASVLPVGGSALRITAAMDAQSEGLDLLAFEVEGREPGELDREQNLGLGIEIVPAGEVLPPSPSTKALNIDHVVIASGDSARCAAHFRDALGLEIKRTMSRPGTGAHLEFAKLGDVILEFAGPPEPRPGPLNAKYWGMVFTVADMDATLSDLRSAGYQHTDPRAAVQPGAVISTIKGYTGGVPLAVIQYNAL